MRPESRLLAVRALARLPLFQLSTAGMELFHTNMLYWLATERPDESVALWNAFGLPGARVDNHLPFIRREWHHIDLVVAPGDGQPALVLENKIGAIPSPGQLDGYSTRLRSTQPLFSLESDRFMLLTLTPPSFVPPGPWRSITYRDLLPALREAARTLAGADAALIRGYSDLVDWLDTVATAYDPAFDLDATIALSGEEGHVLSESRLVPLVEKVRTARFAGIAAELLTATLGWTLPIETGFSNGSGIIQGFVDGPYGRRFGWQVQGGTFRLAVITEEQDRRNIAKQVSLVAKLYERYFDFTVPHHLSHLLIPYTGRKDWYSFAPGFVYRHRPLAPGTTWNDLLGLADWFSRRAYGFAAGTSATAVRR